MIARRSMLRARRALQGGARTAAPVVVAAVRAFLQDRCTLLAAGIAFYVLLSLLPLVVVLVSIFGLVMRNDSIREDVLDELVSALPLTDDGARDIENLLETVASGRSAIGFVALAGLLWSASAMMSALRNALDVVWRIRSRSFLRGKLFDLGLVAGAGLLVGLSFGLTIVTQFVRRLGEDIADALGPFGNGAVWAAWGLGVLIPLLLTALIFALLYRFVPATPATSRQVVIGALVAAAGFELLKIGFAFYLANFGDYDVVYGSLGAVIAFLVFVYLSTCVFLFGAELARAVEPGGREA